MTQCRAPGCATKTICGSKILTCIHACAIGSSTFRLVSFVVLSNVGKALPSPKLTTRKRGIAVDMRTTPALPTCSWRQHQKHYNQQITDVSSSKLAADRPLHRTMKPNTKWSFACFCALLYPIVRSSFSWLHELPEVGRAAFAINPFQEIESDGAHAQDASEKFRRYCDPALRDRRSSLDQTDCAARS